MEPQTDKIPPTDIGEHWRHSFRSTGAIAPEPKRAGRPTTTVAPAAPVSAGPAPITVAEVQPVTDGILDSMAVMMRVEAPDKPAKLKLAESWVPFATKYRHWFKSTPEIAAALGTFVCMQPMMAQYRENQALKKVEAGLDDDAERGEVEARKEPDF